MGMRNRHVKFGLKIPSRFGNIATSPQGGIFYFDSHCIHIYCPVAMPLVKIEIH